MDDPHQLLRALTPEEIRFRREYELALKRDELDRQREALDEQYVTGETMPPDVNDRYDAPDPAMDWLCVLAALGVIVLGIVAVVWMFWTR